MEFANKKSRTTCFPAMMIMMTMVNEVVAMTVMNHEDDYDKPQV